MAHPFNDKRANKVERARVSRMTAGYADGDADDSVKHYATGGAVKSVNNAPEGRATGGKVAPHRADRRARGGKVKGKGHTTVNVVVGHNPAGGSPPMAAAPQAALPPRPLAPPIPPAGGPPMAAPPGGPPMLMRAKGGGVMKGVDDGGDNGADRMVSGKGERMGGIMTASLGVKDVAGRSNAAMERNYGEGRKKGGRVTQRATGGGVNGLYPTSKGTPVWRSSVEDGTPVQHSGNKSDGQSIGRDKVITYAKGGKVKKRDDGGTVQPKDTGDNMDASNANPPWYTKGRTPKKTGGAVEHAVKGQMAPHLPGGSGGGEARLTKAHKRHSAVKGTFSNATGK